MTSAQATIHHQRRSAFLLVTLVAFFCTVPVLVAYSPENGVTWTSFAGTFVWIFNLWLFGWTRMEMAASLVFTHHGDVDTNAAEAFLTGRALTLPDAQGQPIEAKITIMQVRQNRLPSCAGRFRTKDGTLRDLTPQETAALTTILTHNGPAHRLHMASWNKRIFVLDTTSHTRHQALALIKAAQDAVEAENATPAAPVRAHALHRLFPGRLPV